MKVTRVAFSGDLNPGKYAALLEEAARLGRVRSQVWQRYGSVAGAGLRDRQVRDAWLADGLHRQFGVLANAWKETVRDAMADITANAAAAKVKVKQAIRRHTTDPAEQKRLYTALKTDRWASDAYLARQMRKYWRRGHNRTHNQIVVRADQHNTRADETGRLWLAVPGLVQRKMVRIPLNTTVAPTGTLRLILRNQRVEVHYQIDAGAMKTSQQPCGTRTIGVDKGYTEVLTDSDGNHHGLRLGVLLTAESDHRKVKGRARARSGDRFHCTLCGVVWQADVNAAINVRQRHDDPDITLHTPHRRVKQIVQARADRHRTRLPVQDSSSARRAESEPSINAHTQVGAMKEAGSAWTS